MSSAIQNKIEKALGDGARATKYDVMFQFTNPNGAPSPDDVTILAKTAQFPGKAHSVINLKYRGRNIPLKGQTRYAQNWDCTFYLTQDHALKAAFENWMEALDQQNNYMDVDKVNDIIRPTQEIHYYYGDYTAPIKIHQRNFQDSDTTAIYTLHNCFPIQINAPQLSAESVGQILEFTVTFSYSYHTISNQKGTAGNFVDELAGQVKKFATDKIRGAVGVIAGNINNFVSDAKDQVMEKLEELNSQPNSTISENEMKDLGNGGSELSFFGEPLSEISIKEVSNTLTTNLNDTLDKLKSKFT